MIEIKNIHKFYYDEKGTKHVILNDVSLSLEILKSKIIIGQSGIGKSTLLKIISNLTLPDAGTIDVCNLKIGMLFQKNALFDSMTVYENMKFVLEEKKIPKNKIKTMVLELLEQVGLQESLTQYPASLSGGMQKRLGLARALIIQPELLLLDEPTAGLDPITSKQIVDLINNYRSKHNITVIGVTSDVDRAFDLADEICLLLHDKSGVICRDGGTKENILKSQDLHFKQFIKGEIKGPLTQMQSDPMDF